MSDITRKKSAIPEGLDDNGIAEEEREENLHSDIRSSIAYEKETIINYNNAEKEAVYYSLRRHDIEMIQRLAEKYPDDVHIRAQRDGAIEATLPKSWVKIRPPSQRSDEKRVAMAERAKALYANHAAKKAIEKKSEE